MLDALFARIDDQAEALIALTQDLVRIPTVNPPGGGYEACAGFLGERLEGAGFQVEYIRAEGEIGDSAPYPRTNVVARLEGAGPGRTVHFNGHVDVVEAGLGWTVEPFDGIVKGGRIYGRGTCDMKAGIAASVIALEAILAEGISFNGALEISGTVDEESGGYAGVAHLARKGFFSRPRVDHVIIPEPLNVDRICIGHRGVWWAEIETFGKIAHGSMPFLGDCAIRHMGAFMRRLEDQLLPALAARRTGMPVVPEGARQSTLNLAAVHGGLPEVIDGLPSPNVSDRCRMLLDRRFPIEEALDDVKAEIVAILDDLTRSRPGFRYAVKDVMEVMPTLTPDDADVVQAVAESVSQVLGRQPELIVSPGSYDQKHVHRIGHLEECIAYGPGILDLAHQPDEYVEIDHLIASTKVMAASALRLLGVPVH
ncbi:MAG: acetylornithine deacetylase/succinyl-diaminopimelate desuccinylase family protein [Geminicoccaceae bacterium]